MNSFGRKKKFIQEANRRSVLKGTVGMFGRWCRAQGLASNGKVTRACINKGLRSKNTTIIRRANFARNIGGYVGAVHRRRSRFGKKETNIKKKYTPSGGRKSPGVSATKFPVGTVKTGLDGGNWIIKKASNGTKRWVKMKSMFGKYKFGKNKFGKILKKKKLLKSFQNEIETAEKIVEKYPYNDSLKSRAKRLINKAKEKIAYAFSYDNLLYTVDYLRSITSIINSLTNIFSSIGYMTNTFNDLKQTSKTFSNVVRGVSSLLNLFVKQHNTNEDRFLELKFSHLPKDEKEMEIRLWKLKHSNFVDDIFPSPPKHKHGHGRGGGGYDGQPPPTEFIRY